MKYADIRRSASSSWRPCSFAKCSSSCAFTVLVCLSRSKRYSSAGVGGDAGDALEHLLGLLGRDALVLREVVRLAALEVDGSVGRELERVVGHLDHGGVVVAGCLGEPLLEIPLADVAPGAGDVTPHVDLDGIRHVRDNRAAVAAYSDGFPFGGFASGTNRNRTRTSSYGTTRVEASGDHSSGTRYRRPPPWVSRRSP